MEPIVLDSSILAASFLEWDRFHDIGQTYVNALENGDFTFHMPMLVVVEVISAISRQASRNRQALLIRAQKSLTDWEEQGRILLYPLDRDRMYHGVGAALQYRLRGSDALIASLSSELGLPLKTTDGEILARFQSSST